MTKVFSCAVTGSCDFSVNSLNELTSLSRSGNLTVSGGTTPEATSVTVNGSWASLFSDNTFAREGLSWTSGDNTFTAVASDALGRQATDSVTVNMQSSASFVYDDNGNLTSDGRRTFAYEDENQLVSVTLSGEWKVEFVYDGKMRRRIRKEYEWVSSAWKQVAETRYIYDGMLVVQERDQWNAPKATYTRGTDLSGSLSGAGGIGGLLSRTDHGSQAHAYYHADGNGNVTMLKRRPVENVKKLIGLSKSGSPPNIFLELDR